MHVIFNNNEIEKICTNPDYAKKKYGKNMAYKIFERINFMISTKDVETMIRIRYGRCHKLKGDREGQYSLDLVHPYRLIFESYDGYVVVAKIIEIVDYH